LHAAPPEDEPALRDNHAIQRREGAEIALLGAEKLAARFPWLALDGITLGSLGLKGEGWFDGYGLMQAFRRKARALGADYVAAEAVGLGRGGARIAAGEVGGGGAAAGGGPVKCGGGWGGRGAGAGGRPPAVRGAAG